MSDKDIGAAMDTYISVISTLKIENFKDSGLMEDILLMKQISMTLKDLKN